MLEMFRKYPRKDIISPISNISGLVREGNDLFSDKLILLDESLSGNLFCAETIVVEQNGKLSGNITSKSCVVSGTINGNIVSTDQMDIKSTAIIKGNIQSALINIEPGAVINGCVTIMQDTAAVTDLSEKIKGYSPDEYQDAKAAGELAELNRVQVDVPSTVFTAINDEKLQDQPVQIVHEPIVVEQPIAKKELVAPTKAPVSAPADENINQRWW